MSGSVDWTTDALCAPFDGDRWYTDPATAGAQPSDAYRRWIVAHDQEVREQVAREHGVGDLTSRPLYDAQERIGQLEDLVHYLRRENRRLENSIARGEGSE